MEILKHIRLLLCGLCLWFSSETAAQIQSSEDAYQALDAFLAQPTAQSCIDFKSVLAQWNSNSKEEHLAKVISLSNLGFYQQRYFNPTTSIASYEEANLLYHQHQLKGFDMINSCSIPLGNLYTQINALTEAENTIKAYILEAQQDKRTRETVAGLENLSIVFHNKGNYNRAIAVLQQALKLEPNNLSVQLNLANNYYGNGETVISEEIVKKILLVHPNHLKANQLLAKIQITSNKPLLALSSLKKTLTILKSSRETPSRELAKLYLALAQAELAINAPENAENYIKEVYNTLVAGFNPKQEIPARNQLFPENTFIDALDLQAKIYVQKGENKKALQSYDLAFEVSQLLNATSFMQDSKLAFQTMHKNRSEACLNLLFELHQETSDTLWLYKALAIEQQAKSPVLREAKQWQQRVLAVTDTLLAARLKQVQLEVAKAGTVLRQAPMQVMNNPELIRDSQNQYTVAIEKQRRLFKELGQRYPKISISPPVSTEILEQKVIRSGKTLVSYFIGNESLFQFEIAQTGVSFKRLAHSKNGVNVILQYVKNYNSFFENASLISNDPLAYSKEAYQLYQALQIPKTEKLVIIPDGILSFVPFSTLHTRPSNSLSFQEMPFLVLDTEISYALSISEYINEKERNHNKKVLGVFPVFKGTARELTHSLVEATAIHKMTKGVLLIENEATAANFLAQMDDYDILHISTHAKAGTFTQPAGIEFIDKTLTIDELYGYQFNKDLVVLSACETGVGKVIKGEGVQSMARAFQYTGTKNVLFTLWKVNDQSTAQLMENFYKRLNHTNDRSYSLHQAQLDYLKAPHIDNTKKSPYFWAAFVYYGEAEPMPNTTHLMIFWIGLSLLLIVGLWFKYRQKRKRMIKLQSLIKQ